MLKPLCERKGPGGPPSSFEWDLFFSSARNTSSTTNRLFRVPLSQKSPQLSAVNPVFDVQVGEIFAPTGGHQKRVWRCAKYTRPLGRDFLQKFTGGMVEKKAHLLLWHVKSTQTSSEESHGNSERRGRFDGLVDSLFPSQVFQ